MAKTTGKSTGAKKANPLPVGALIPQPHGGAIRNGGTNVGGTGRPPSAIRASLREDFDTRRKILNEIADDDQAPRSERIKAVETIGKFGLGTMKEVLVEDVQDRLKATIHEIYLALPKTEADALVDRIESHWR